MELTDEQWLAIEPYIPAAERRAPRSKGGRPWASARDVLNGVLWVLRTGAPWADLPPRYPPYKRRWKVERLFAWLKRWRRLAMRWEYKAENFLGLLHLGCMVLLLRKLHPRRE